MKPQKKIKLGNNGEPIESEEARDIKFDAMKESQPQKKIKKTDLNPKHQNWYKQMKKQGINPEQFITPNPREKETTFDGYGGCNAKTSTMLPTTKTPNPQENWEEEWDKLLSDYNDDTSINEKDLKQFIRQLLSQERKKVVEEIERQYKDAKWDDENSETWNVEFIDGWNTCLSEIIKRLKDEKGQI